MNVRGRELLPNVLRLCQRNQKFSPSFLPHIRAQLLVRGLAWSSEHGAKFLTLSGSVDVKLLPHFLEWMLYLVYVVSKLDMSV